MRIVQFDGCVSDISFDTRSDETARVSLDHLLVVESRRTMSSRLSPEASLARSKHFISEILPIAGAELAGPLPTELQNHVVSAPPPSRPMLRASSSIF
jgi:hypothetical protein